MATTHLLNEYNMPIFDNSLSYWSMQFISVLECLAYHKTLEYPSIYVGGTIGSLARMKGNYPNSFFDMMSNYIKNWGMQYFMVHFLNHKISLDIVDHVKEHLDDLFDIPNYKDYEEFNFYISGHDSDLSKNIGERFDEIYPKTFDLNFLEKENLIRNSDICLILKNRGENKNIAIFGEIEGNYGDRLFTPKFWDKKSEFCILGIGAVQGYNKGVFYIEKYLHQGKYPKLNIIFEKHSYVVHDFHYVISEFQQIFNYGAKYRCYNSNYGYIVNEIIIKNWNKPISCILDELYHLKDNHENLIGEIDKGEIKLITPYDI